jgi:hypothetical protein
MLIDFKLSARQTKRTFRALDALADFPNREYMAGLQRLIIRANGRRFAAETGPDGRKWQRWSKSYRKRGAPFHGNHRRLHLTGALAMSIHEGPIHLGAGVAAAEVGYSDPKARWHHFGEGRLPIREIIGIAPSDVTAAGRHGIRHLSGLIRGSR